MSPTRKSKLFAKCLKEIHKISKAKGAKLLRKEICRILKENIPYYNWVGFYLSDGKESLILDEYVGEPTIHTKIKYGVGICGQVALTKKTLIVPDVAKEENYLSCSIKVKSEIVVPIFKNGEFIGELDIDSHLLDAFSKEDKEFLENICHIISQH
ncbi:MAG: GAF domain-containing protein [Deltaproteobacteria bacterium]|nr:GAF domain-containing protein [Deltaproteobacteria bacterium]